MMKNHYHLHVVRNQLTRSLTSLFDDVRDEIEHAFNDLIPAKENGESFEKALDLLLFIISSRMDRYTCPGHCEECGVQG